MSEPHSDRELEQYLAGRSPASRNYAALGAEEPPATLDARIVEEARAAVQSKHPASRSPLWWLRPVTLAATVLLSLTLVLRLTEFGSRRELARTGAEIPAPGEEPSVPVTVLPPQESDNAALKEEPAPPARQMKLAPPRAPAPKSAEPNKTVEEVVVTSRKPREEKLRGTPLAITAFDDKANEGAAELSASPGTLGHETMVRIEKEIESRLAGAKPEMASPAETRLREIQALQKSAAEVEVADALVQFAHDFPDDPISTLVRLPAE